MKKGEHIPKKGAPSQFQEWMADELPDLGRQGLTLSQIAEKWGVQRSTLYNWAADNNAFKEAMALRKNHFRAFMERKLMDMALNNAPGNIKAMQIALRSLVGDEYKEEARAGTEINIGSINSINQLDDDSLNAKIAHSIKLLGLESEGTDEQGTKTGASGAS